jgi:hypothetical protein
MFMNGLASYLRSNTEGVTLAAQAATWAWASHCPLGLSPPASPAKVGRLLSHRSRSDGRASFSEERKVRTVGSPKILRPFLFSPFAFLTTTASRRRCQTTGRARGRKDGGVVADPFAGARVRPSRGSVEWSHGGALRAKSTRT